MKIICIGQNYYKHIAELNNSIPENPVFFLKPETALMKNGEDFYIPDFSNEIHHEIELVVKINKLGKNISEKFANRYYNEISIGLDFTARDLQSEARKNGLPWEISKAFDNSAPIGEFININDIKEINNLTFSLNINEKLVQKGSVSDMIFKIDYIISYVSKFITLKVGDLIYTGTPEGVGQVKIGDRLDGFIEDKKLLTINIK